MIEIVYTDGFKRQYKQLLKKFPSLTDDLKTLLERLYQNPKTGTPLGHDTYKIRLAVKSKVKGKSGGLRVITFLQLAVPESGVLYLLAIYDKSDLSTIANSELKKLIHALRAEKR